MHHECIHSHTCTTFADACKHTHPQSRNSINIQGELSLERVCVSAALTSKRQRERERMAVQKKARKREREWQWEMEGKRLKKVNSGSFDSLFASEAEWQEYRERGMTEEEKMGRRRGWRKWHLDLSQKTNSNPGHSYDKLRVLITTAVGQKLTSAERSGLRNQKSGAASWIGATVESQHGVRMAVITFVLSNIKVSDHRSCHSN